MKAGKEEIVGLLAAVRWYLNLDHAELRRAYAAQVQNVLEAVSAARWAAARAGIEAERSRCVAALYRKRFLREQLTDGIQRSHIAGGIGARGLADGRLVDQHDIVDVLGAANGTMEPRRVDRPAFELAQSPVADVFDQRRLAGAAAAGYAHESIQRQAYVDVLEVVLSGADVPSGNAWIARAPRAFRKRPPCRHARRARDPNPAPGPPPA